MIKSYIGIMVDIITVHRCYIAQCVMLISSSGYKQR